MSVLLDVAKALPAVGGVISAISSIGADKRQLKQQKELTQVQEESAKRLAKHQTGEAMDIWNRTNIGAQKEHIENAGMNAALMYGTSGSSGTTAGAATPMPTGGTAATAAATEANKIQMGMGLAQLGLIQAQTEKTKAEATKIAGADTTKTQEETNSIAFQNAINKLVGEENFAQNINWAQSKLQNESMKTMHEYNAWEKANFAGEPSDNDNSPLAKAMKAGLEQSLIDLKKAKAEANTAEAEAIIKKFTAQLTQQGIAEGTPWYVKFATDLLTKAGINVSNTAADTIKK